MLKHVLRRTGRNPAYPGRWRVTRIHGARRARIPGMPWFRCFTNRWWSPRYQRSRYILSEATTGFTPTTIADDTRQQAIWYASMRLKSRRRPIILAAIARVQAGHLDRQRPPRRFRARSL